MEHTHVFKDQRYARGDGNQCHHHRRLHGSNLPSILHGHLHSGPFHYRTALRGIALSVLDALGACHRIHHFAFAGAAITLNIVALLCISTHSFYSIGSIDRLGEIAFGGVVGVAFAIGAGYKRLRQTSTPS